MKQPIKRKIAVANGITNEKQIYTLIVDGNNLLKRSLTDKRMNNSGEQYGGVVRFINRLGIILSKKDFDYCIVSWDGPGSGILRWRMYEDYKANRDKHYDMLNAETDYDKYYRDFRRKVIEARKKKPTVRGETDEEAFQRQKNIIQDILEELCIRQYEFEDVEGDDIVAYYVKNKKPNEKVVIMSTDRDMTQLISDSVIIWNPSKDDFVTTKNSVQALGITHENIVLEKILCGDVSDNIKGVKGLGEQTLVKYFPELITTKTDLETVVRRSKELLEERKANKQKPLKVLENIVNGVTDGCQGDKLYEVNRKIIDLSEPLLTEEAKEYLDYRLYGVIDTSERDTKNVYRIVEKNKMFDMLDEEKFGNILAPYSRIITMERKRYGEFKKAAGEG
jgi:5'-3' exonuclease